jgi:hypothetical protein
MIKISTVEFIPKSGRTTLNGGKRFELIPTLNPSPLRKEGLKTYRVNLPI